MKSKGAIKLFAIALTVVCLFQLSFTWFTYRAEQEAKEYANGDVLKERAYLDSIAREPLVNLGFKQFNYLECKERELNLGLDLQGGMNVTLEVSIGDLVKALANNTTDATFNEAIQLTNEKIKTTQKDYVTLFGESYAELAPDGKLAPFFANQNNKDKVKPTSTNAEVVNYLKEEANQAIDRSFQILRARIDKFGVTQPNIQKLEGNGRILVELPGVDNPTRVRKLLQGSAKLEFYETYTNPEAFKFLSDANKALSVAIAADKANGKGDSTTASTSDSTKTSSALSGIANKNPKSSTDTLAKSDSTQKQLEDFTKENPLFVVLRPNADDKGQLAERGSNCGMSVIRDTAKVNSLIDRARSLGALPSNIRFLWESKAVGDNGEIVMLHAIKPGMNGGAQLEGDKVIDARRDVGQSGEVEVTMMMNGQGASQWRNLTKANIGRSIAIVLDDVVYSSPNVQNEIPNGRSSITGSFTVEEANDLANILKAGKLPAPTRIVEEAVVGPTLGAESINQGLLSMVVATIIILIFMVVYYSNSGYIADLAVLANVFFIIGVLASLGAALTLPGIAGIVLTIGMAVDANVLINERIKEEILHNARSLKNAVADGYAHAASSIIDANLTTLLAGVVLYSFGTGPVQGFAITLIIGILSSMFTAVLLSRVLTEWQLDKGKVVKYATAATEKLFRNINYEWVGKRKRFYLFSGVLIAAGLVSMFTKGFTLGVDFKGGWTYVVEFSKPVSQADIRTALEVPFEGAPEVKSYGSDSKYKITTTYLINESSESASDQVESKLKEGLTKIDGNVSILSSAKVGPTVANDIKISSFWASIIALLGIGLYILIRFRKWQYALGAIIALTHDVLMMLSFYSIFDGILPFPMEVDQNFIAAILTIIGFSINDTVVVFDRIREYMNNNKAESNKSLIINNALNNTLNRTIITSLTVFLVALVLFIFGGEVIKGFTFALLVGIIFGTYSSIGIATPIVIDFDKKNKA